LSGEIPARRVLGEAEVRRRAAGHENEGFLSEAHGFLPAEEPLRGFGDGPHAAWDELAARMPELHASLGLRAFVDAMPVLPADGTALPDRALLRAATLLGCAAHAYVRIASPVDVPPQLARPWEQVARRLGRPYAYLTYVDLVVHNWRLREPGGPRRVENMEMLAATVGSQEEQIFHLTQVEILAESRGLVASVVRAQEAATVGDAAGVARELMGMRDVLHAVQHASFLKIDPNPRSRFHVDPVVWAKTVAPMAVPLREGLPGPSGTSSPLFHLLDAFFERGAYRAALGREALHIRAAHPPAWRAMFDAVAQVGVREFVERSGDRELAGVYRDALDTYAGPHGFLGRHRLKVYGYLELAFKVGRSVTIGGYKGLFQDRTWDQVDDELEQSRAERTPEAFPHCHAAVVRSVERANPDAERPVWDVVLDVAGQGLRAAPGDRCMILPENGPELVERTVRALRARGDERIPLSRLWQSAMEARAEAGLVHGDARELPLSVLLRHARIRPVSREAAKMLLAASGSEALARIIEARAEDQWELWDVLELLARGGFAVQRLWHARPGEPEYVGRIAPPLWFTSYSIGKIAGRGPLAEQLGLTVGALVYRTVEGEASRAEARTGTASGFLGDPRSVGKRIGVRILRPPRFAPPADATLPIVLVGGGTGAAPFQAFLDARAADPRSGPAMLFLGLAGRGDLAHAEELAAQVRSGRLELRIALSREDAQIDASREGIAFGAGERRRIGSLLEAEERAIAGALAAGGHVYVCGRAAFARSVADAMEAILGRHGSSLPELVADGRYHQEVFTTYSGPSFAAARQLDASEVVLRNDARNGYWIIVRGRVYDVSSFLELHPGGRKLLRGYAGMDATRGYEKVQHHVSPEIDSMLAMYELGAIRRLHFGSVWGVAVGARGLELVMLGDVFRAWLRYLYLVVEMENALDNDASLDGRALTSADPPGGATPYARKLARETRRRFVDVYLRALSGAPLERLWAMTIGLVRSSEDAHGIARAVGESFRGARGAGDAAEEGVGPREAALLRAVKLAIREGVTTFERHERDTVRQAGHGLLEPLRSVPRLVAEYLRAEA
jgi:sulfite reductase (NADPH) flavoprotein alpha-component